MVDSRQSTITVSHVHHAVHYITGTQAQPRLGTRNRGEGGLGYLHRGELKLLVDGMGLWTLVDVGSH